MGVLQPCPSGKAVAVQPFHPWPDPRAWRAGQAMWAAHHRLPHYRCAPVQLCAALMRRCVKAPHRPRSRDTRWRPQPSESRHAGPGPELAGPSSASVTSPGAPWPSPSSATS